MPSIEVMYFPYYLIYSLSRELKGIKNILLGRGSKLSTTQLGKENGLSLQEGRTSGLPKKVIPKPPSTQHLKHSVLNHEQLCCSSCIISLCLSSKYGIFPFSLHSGLSPDSLTCLQTPGLKGSSGLPITLTH